MSAVVVSRRQRHKEFPEREKFFQLRARKASASCSIPPWLFQGKPTARQAQGETALRGSNKPRPVCNGPDMPTSIWSFIVRNSMEPHTLRRANDDRRPSIDASQARHEDRRGHRPLESMAKVAPLGVGRDMPHRICPLKGLSRMKGNFHVRF